MAEIKQNLAALVGNTPLMELGRIEKRFTAGARLLAKLEFFNPGGSVKDRAARAMIEDAEAKGLIRPGSVIIEPTSGNTGIGLAAVAAFKGYRVIIVMPDSAPKAHQELLCAYNAEVALSDGAQGIRGAIAKAEKLAAALPDSFIPGQFANPANPQAHFAETGPEIWRQTGGKADYLVAGVGTGGTISGAGAFLKSVNPAIRVIAVEPESSPFLSLGKSGRHRIQGIGAGFAPAVLNVHIYDEVLRVSDEAAFEMSRTLARSEGLIAGPSSGAALAAGLELAGRGEAQGKNIVMIFPDSGERYITPEAL